MKTNKRVLFFGIALLFLLVAAMVAQARIERKYRTSAGAHISLIVDSVDYRTDLTRIYGKLIGRPHTSQRIDRVELKNGPRIYKSTDIDGVDFNRWFQWEDEGVITVELDFEAMRPAENAQIVITTPRGTDTINLNRK